MNNVSKSHFYYSYNRPRPNSLDADTWMPAKDGSTRNIRREIYMLLWRYAAMQWNIMLDMLLEWLLRRLVENTAIELPKRCSSG